MHRKTIFLKTLGKTLKKEKAGKADCMTNVIYFFAYSSLTEIFAILLLAINDSCFTTIKEATLLSIGREVDFFW